MSRRGADNEHALASGVCELHSAVINSRDLSSWEQFWIEIFDIEPVWNFDRSEMRVFLGDEAEERFVVRASDSNGLAALRWRVANADGLARVAAEAGDLPACEHPLARPLILTDPLGVEHHVEIRRDTPTPASAASGMRFVTGDQGFGHAVFRVDDVEKFAYLYQGAFAMVLREEMVTLVGTEGRFYGCSPRHHSIALVERSGPDEPVGVMHLMVELVDLDLVGRALDRAKDSAWLPRTELGRHRTDNMVSFYVPTPAGFDFEIGCFGLRVDDRTWTTEKESTRKTPWGHGGVNSQAAV